MIIKQPFDRNRSDLMTQNKENTPAIYISDPQKWGTGFVNFVYITQVQLSLSERFYIVDASDGEVICS